MNWFARYWHYQWCDSSNVIPSHNWSAFERAFYLNSCAGTIRFKPRTRQDMMKFRDKYINEFEMIMSTWEEGDRGAANKAFYSLYSRIRSDFSVKYRANLRTRIKSLRYAI